MIVYNVTANVSEEIADEWVAWMKETHILRVMETGCFEGFKILRMVGNQHNADGLTFAVQYFAKDMKTMNLYASQYAPVLQQAVFERYGEKVLSFRTLMEEI